MDEIEEKIRQQVKEEVKQEVMAELAKAKNLNAQLIEDAAKQTIVPANHFGGTIQKLNGTNYLPWRRQVGSLLKVKGLELAITEGAVVPEMLDVHATLILLESMDQAHQLQVQAEKTAHDILKSLERQYANRSQANKHKLMSDFMKLQKDPRESLNHHVGRLKELKSALTDMGEEVSEAFFQVTILNSLGKDYETIFESWELTHPDMKNTDFLLSILQKREELLLKNANRNLLLVKGQRKAWNELTIEEKKKISRCKNCHQKGHWANDSECPSKNVDNFLRTQGVPGQSSKKANVVLNLGKLESGLKKEWIIDSGATEHMSNSKEWFKELHLYKSPKYASVGNGDQIEVLGQGTIEIITDSGDGQISITLTNVCYMPSLATNIISVAAATKMGANVSFSQNQCQLVKEDLVVMTGKLRDNLFVLSLTNKAQEFKGTLIVKRERTLNEWHRALGHPGKERLIKLLRDPKLRLKGTGALDICEVCPAAKGAHASHPASSREKAEQPGDMIHIDIGSMTEAQSGVRHYYLLSVDEYSDYCFITILNRKSEALTSLETLICQVELECGNRIKRIRSDNGMEFLSKEAKLLMIKEQIAHETTAPHTPAQNGRVEREMRTTNETARALLFQSGMESHLIPEALRTAVYLKNRLPTSKNDTTPHEMFTGRKPLLFNLIEFGKQVQVLDNLHTKTKSEPRTENGFLVGFTSRCNTYRVYVPAYKRVIETCDIFIVPHYKPVEGDRIAEFDGMEYHAEHRGSLADEVTRDWCDEPIPPTDRGEMQPSELFRTAVDFPWTSTTRKPEERRIITGPELDTFFEDTVQGWRLERLQRTSENGSLGPQLTDKESDEGQISDSQENRDCENQAPEQQEEATFERRGEAAELERAVELPPILTPHTSADRVPGSERERIEQTQTGQNSHTFAKERPKRRPPPIPARYLCMVETNFDLPTSYKQATTGPNKGLWLSAINEELAAHETNSTWEIRDRPLDGVKLTAKWVFAVKKDKEGAVKRFKARLVARGFEQREGLDFNEIFAPVAKTDSIRAVVALVATLSLEMLQFDVCTAFLNGRLEETVYVEPPDGVEVEPGKCLKLIKALYGLKQAPRAWHRRLNECLSAMGFRSTWSDQCIYTNPTSGVWLIIYVDDGLIVAKERQRCEEVFQQLQAEFKIKRLDACLFVGFEIERKSTSIKISQKQYTCELINRFKMDEAKASRNLILDPDQLMDNSQDRPTNAPYREAVGALLYLATCSRPDILFMVNTLARFSSNPQDHHWTAVKQVFRYLKHTVEHHIEYYKDDHKLLAYSDADWGSILTGRGSTSGTLIIYGGGPVVYGSRRQRSIALSTAEAEYVAASEVICDLKWMIQLLSELGVKHSPPKLYVDNLPTIRQIRNTDTKRRSRHIDLRYHSIKQEYLNKTFELEHISTDLNPADILTKPLGGAKLSQTIETTGIMKKGIDSRAKPVFAVMFLLGLLMRAHSWKFTKVDPVIWVPTDHYVDLGVGVFGIEYHFEHPCGVLATALEDNLTRAKATSINRSADRFYTLCKHELELNWLPDFNRLPSCDEEREGHLRYVQSRFKREPISLTIGFLAVVSSIVTTGVVLDQKINTVSSSLDEAKKEISAHREALETQKQINGNLTTAVERLNSQSQALMQDMASYSTQMPDLVWSSTRIYSSFVESRNAIRNLHTMCKKGLVDTTALSHLANKTDLRYVDPKATHILSVDRMVGGVTGFEMAYTAPRVSTNTHVYKVQAFKIWANLTEQDPKMLEYTGPRFLIHNFELNCTKGILDPDVAAVYDRCEEKDYGDPLLQSWREVATNDTTPQIKKTKTHSYIQCLYNDITIGNTTYHCPPNVFRLPLLQMFTAGNHSHAVEMVRINITGEIQPPRGKHLNFSLFEEDISDQLNLIKTVRDLNTKLGATLNSRRSIMDIVESTDAWSLLTIIPTIFTVGFCLFNVLFRRAAAAAAQNEYITINTQTPANAPERAAIPTPYYPNLGTRNIYDRPEGVAYV